MVLIMILVKIFNTIEVDHKCSVIQRRGLIWFS